MIDFILRPIRRRFGKDRKFYAAIDDMFGFIPHNIELYKLALIHKSASVTLDDGRQINNERLEFLGDAVIESVTSDYLFIEFPDQNEGFLTQLRSKMVSRQSLNEVAKRLNLDAHVITHSSASFSQKHIYGDAFEAMMGAIYLDQGYDFVNRLLINRIFGDYLRAGTLLEEETDFKSRLIEWCQKKHHTIRFITSHDKNYSSAHPVFICKVLIDDIEAGYGSGDSKKEAEQHAAFSVSQGFREEDCTKLFDKLDAIERGLASTPRRPAAETTAKDTTANEETDDNTAKASGRSRSSRRSRRRAAENNDTAEAAEQQTASTETAESTPDTAAGNEPAQAAYDDTVTPEESVTAEAGDTDTAAAPDATTETDTDTASDDSAKPSGRSRSSRRSRRRAAQPATAEGEGDDAGNEPAEEAQSVTDIEAESDTETATSEPATEVDNTEAVTELPAGEKAAAPKRRSRRRQPKAVQEAEATEAVAVVEPVAETTDYNATEDSSAEASATDAGTENPAPKRRTRRRPSKAAKVSADNTETDEATTVEPAEITAAEPAETVTTQHVSESAAANADSDRPTEAATPEKSE